METNSLRDFRFLISFSLSLGSSLFFSLGRTRSLFPILFYFIFLCSLCSSTMRG
ncbi:hypothetical protein Scep_028352 [Stephania cephalantha]|uniref:Uncharacterized protein n=1 Tax=Stephania cephalantha TaxID=152367 RepID=A0AAP0EBZ3_9MAGN